MSENTFVSLISDDEDDEGDFEIVSSSVTKTNPKKKSKKEKNAGTSVPIMIDLDSSDDDDDDDDDDNDDVEEEKQEGKHESIKRSSLKLGQKNSCRVCASQVAKMDMVGNVCKICATLLNEDEDFAEKPAAAASKQATPTRMNTNQNVQLCSLCQDECPLGSLKNGLCEMCDVLEKEQQNQNQIQNKNNNNKKPASRKRKTRRKVNTEPLCLLCGRVSSSPLLKCACCNIHVHAICHDVDPPFQNWRCDNCVGKPILTNIETEPVYQTPVAKAPFNIATPPIKQSSFDASKNGLSNYSSQRNLAKDPNSKKRKKVASQNKVGYHQKEKIDQFFSFSSAVEHCVERSKRKKISNQNANLAGMKGVPPMSSRARKMLLLAREKQPFKSGSTSSSYQKYNNNKPKSNKPPNGHYIYNSASKRKKYESKKPYKTGFSYEWQAKAYEDQEEDPFAGLNAWEGSGSLTYF